MERESFDITKYWKIEGAKLQHFRMFADQQLSKYTAPKENVSWWVEYDFCKHTAVCTMDIEVLNILTVMYQAKLSLTFFLGNDYDCTNIPNAAQARMAAITYDTLRGILFEQSKNTPLSSYILPSRHFE